MSRISHLICEIVEIHVLTNYKSCSSEKPINTHTKNWLEQECQCSRSRSRIPMLVISNETISFAPIHWHIAFCRELDSKTAFYTNVLVNTLRCLCWIPDECQQKSIHMSVYPYFVLVLFKLSGFVILKKNEHLLFWKFIFWPPNPPNIYLM